MARSSSSPAAAAASARRSRSRCGEGLPRRDRRPRRARGARCRRVAGRRRVGLRLDVTDRPGFTAFLDEVERRLGPLDVLVNNAGIMPVGPFEEEDDATVVRLLEINLHAVIHGTKEAVRRMKPRGTGHIVNVASSAGKTGFPNLATYCATKHGVVGMSEAVRAELRGTGVEISVVMPGIVNTELATGLVETRGFKISTPEDVAGLVVEALEFPRFDVFVPKSIGPTWAALQSCRAAPARRSPGRSRSTARCWTPTSTPARPTRPAPRRARRRPSGLAEAATSRGARRRA